MLLPHSRKIQSRRPTAVSSHCGVFGSRKLWFHEETLSSAERTQFALIRNGVKRPNVVRNFRMMTQIKTYYKYLPIDRISYLENSLLRFTQPKALNDSFECLPTFSRCIELMNELKGKPFSEKFEEVNFIDVEGESIVNDYFSEFEFEFEGFGIFSLSKRYNSNLMWGHYAKHNGFAIGFNINHPFFKKEKFIRGKVKYTNERPVLTRNDLDDSIFFHKSKDWSYEKEYRLIAEMKDCDKVIPNSPSIHLFEIPFETITEIILGLKTKYNDILMIKKFTDEREIPLYRCKKSNKSYLIEKQLIV